MQDVSGQAWAGAHFKACSGTQQRRTFASVLLIYQQRVTVQGFLHLGLQGGLEGALVTRGAVTNLQDTVWIKWHLFCLQLHTLRAQS